jgi:alkanesulfonate monooxygenase SsuD/methylene tetrahydromethanopterin reductase-like flavin-dependent oxidoreductase (luciferase family)
MELGYFTMPSHPPERPLKDGHEWDLEVVRWLDDLGYTECWIGEHHTAPWEPHPSSNLLVAQALMQTKRIRLGPGDFLLPYHHSAELANRVAMLDHISGGRLNFGVAASGLPSDLAMLNVDGEKGVNREMRREALDIILKLWSTSEPFEHVGNFWTVGGILWNCWPKRCCRASDLNRVSRAESAPTADNAETVLRVTFTLPLIVSLA